MMNGANTIFICFKNVFLQCDTVSQNTSHIDLSPKDAWALVENQNGNVCHDSTGSLSDNKKNTPILLGGSGERASINTFGPNDTNSQNKPQTYSTDEVSLNMPSVTFEHSLEDIKSQLIVEMKNVADENLKKMKEMNEENRKEMEDMHEENQKEMKSMIEGNRKEFKKINEDNGKEIKCMIEYNRKEIERLNVDKDSYQKMLKEYEGMERVTKPRQSKARARIGEVQNRVRSDTVN